MGEKKIRLACREDLADILNIYGQARRFMAHNGNPTQWKNGYPWKDLLEEDIEKGQLFVVTEGARVCGVFVFFVGEDPTYAFIENGAWHAQREYGVIHRIAGTGGGIFAAALEFARGRCGYLRIDTHHDNRPMRHVVEKAGFRRCGTIYVEDGTPRIAYDLV